MKRLLNLQGKELTDYINSIKIPKIFYKRISCLDLNERPTYIKCKVLNHTFDGKIEVVTFKYYDKLLHKTFYEACPARDIRKEIYSHRWSKLISGKSIKDLYKK